MLTLMYVTADNFIFCDSPRMCMRKNKKLLMNRMNVNE